MPWKNGDGKTLEIFKIVDHDNDFNWRLSLATIEKSGPFSLFPLHSRIIISLDGGTVSLCHGGDKPFALPVLKPHTFEGNIETFCKLTGPPARDFNIITRKLAGLSQGEVLWGPSEKFVALDANDTIALHIVKGTVRVQLADERYTIKESNTWVGQGFNSHHEKKMGIKLSKDDIVMLAHFRPKKKT